MNRMPEIKVLHQGDESVLSNVAPDVFDNPIDPERTAEFLADPRHHIVVALDEGRVVGFASGVHYVHPDKPPELWINEVGVAPTHQGKGIARHIMDAMLAVARNLGCSEAWVLTDRDNTPAMRLYASAGGQEALQDQVMFTFFLDQD